MAGWSPFDNLRVVLRELTADELATYLSEEALKLKENSLFGNSPGAGVGKTTFIKLFDEHSLMRMPFGYDAVIAKTAWKLLFPDVKPNMEEIYSLSKVNDDKWRNFTKVMDGLYSRDQDYVGVWQAIKVANNDEFFGELSGLESRELRCSTIVVHFHVNEGKRCEPSCLLVGRKADWTGSVDLYETSQQDRYLSLTAARSKEPVRQIYHFPKGADEAHGINLGIANIDGKSGSPIAATKIAIRRVKPLLYYYLLNFEEVRDVSNAISLKEDNSSGFRITKISDYVFNIKSDESIAGISRKLPEPNKKSLYDMYFGYEKMYEFASGRCYAIGEKTGVAVSSK